MLEITNYINNDFKPFDCKETIENIQDFFT